LSAKLIDGTAVAAAMPDGASTDEVLELVSRLSHDDAVDGILADRRRGTGPGRWSPVNALSFGR
jgi:hypothetical protein